MSTTLLEKKFEAIGARIKISEPRSGLDDFKIDVQKDKNGEYFDLKVRKKIEMLVTDVQKQDRHLLLLVRQPDNPKAKFLCGHDERHWFTCALPESARVVNVATAKQALKPKELAVLERHEGLKTKDAQKRHRKLKSGRKIHRQGEFMFIPSDFMPPKGNLTIILKNEPMRGGGTHFHYAEHLYRNGGEAVYVRRDVVISVEEYKRLDKKEKVHWSYMRRNPEVYVKGHIRHEEHATVDLGNVWHKVMVNTEAQAKAARNVAFLD